MKLTAIREDITSNIQGDSHSATIELNAVTFQALSGKIYKNPIKAILRELLCNAKDSHTEARNPDPILLELPAAFNPQLTIEDFGLGMDHATVFSVFTDYFSSTKRNSDALTGGFGLGSKSPYAYTDQFSVIATHNGVRRTYALYKDETNQPKASLVQTEITKARNGTRITIPVRPEDHDKFHEAAQEVARFLGHKIQGVNLPEYPNQGEYHIEGMTALVIMSQYQPLIVQAGVAYPAPRSQPSKLTIIVPPGTFRPTLSRESLEEAPDIHDKLMQTVLQGIADSIQDVINTAPDIGTAIRTLRASPISRLPTLHWRGLPITESDIVIGYARERGTKGRRPITSADLRLGRNPSLICLGPKEFNYMHTPAPADHHTWHLHITGDNPEEQLAKLGYTGIPIEYTANKTKRKGTTTEKRKLQANVHRHATRNSEEYTNGMTPILSDYTPILDCLREISPEIPAPMILTPGQYHNWTCEQLRKLGAFETEDEYLAQNPICPSLVARAIAFHRSDRISTVLLTRCARLPGVDMQLLEMHIYGCRYNPSMLLHLTTEEEVTKETRKMNLRNHHLKLRLEALEHKLARAKGNYIQYLLENT